MNKKKPKDLTYDYTPYDNGFLGKCREVPAILAQGKTQQEVYEILHLMAKRYFELSVDIKNKKL
jgi:hypothetical protein